MAVASDVGIVVADTIAVDVAVEVVDAGKVEVGELEGAVVDVAFGCVAIGLAVEVAVEVATAGVAAVALAVGVPWAGTVR